MRKTLLGLLLLISPAMAMSQPMPGSADLALVAKLPPKSRAKARPSKKEVAVPAGAEIAGASGYDYFHLMAEPTMAGRPTFFAYPAKRRHAAPQAEPLRDAVAAPHPQPKAASR